MCCKSAVLFWNRMIRSETEIHCSKSMFVLCGAMFAVSKQFYVILNAYISVSVQFVCFVTGARGGKEGQGG